MANARPEIVGPELSAYIANHSTQPDDVQRSLMTVTAASTGRAAAMQIGTDQGVFLQIVTRAIGATRALEIGTFTGYSALSIARGLAPNGRLTCCDVSEAWTAIARQHWEQAGVAERIELKIGPALDTIHAMPPGTLFDLAFIDADKTNYGNYYEAVLPMLSATGVILVDNTLWHGSVLDPTIDPDNPRDADKAAIIAFNRKVADDQRVRVVILPIGDGVTMIQRA